MEDKKIEVIGLVGPFGGGKTTTSKYLATKGYFPVRLSQIIEHEIQNKNLGSIKDRKLLQDVGNDLRKKYGSDVLARRAIDYAKKNKATKIVIDGLRNIHEIYFLKEIDGCITIGIDADANTRFSRLNKSTERKHLTKDEFIKLETREKGKGQKDTGLHEEQCWKMRDFEILNNSDEKELFSKIDKLLVKINLRKQKELRIILVGPPGAGKSTQGQMLAQEFKIPWISIGQLLRNESTKDTKEGKIIFDYQSKGLNVPTVIKSKILEKELDKCVNGYILDNYPRSKDDLLHIRKYFESRKKYVDKVFLLKVSQSETVSRILNKGQSHTKGVSRNDTSYEVIKARIREGFEKDLDLVLSYFKKLNVLSIINGQQNVEQVYQDIKRNL